MTDPSWIVIGIAVPPRRKMLVADLRNEQAVKVLGPFETADSAREFVNTTMTGLHEGVVWSVLPLRHPQSLSSL